MYIKTDVVIVGAGPAGALLGYLLAQQNIATVVLEKHSKIDKEFRGEHINEVGEWILKQHNLFEKIRKLGLQLMKRVEYWESGKIIKTIHPDGNAEHLSIHIPQNHLLRVLTEEAKQFADYRLIMGASVFELIQDQTGRYTGVKALQNGTEIRVDASLIVGADGRFSAIRKLAELSTTVRKHGYDVLWAKIPAPQGWEPTIKFALISGQQVSLFTQAGGYVQIGWNIKQDSFHELRKQSFEPFIQRLIAAFPELEKHVRLYIRSWKDFKLLSVFSSQSDTWSKDGLVLIGDAVHTMSPTGAFGINAALMDAHKLADMIISENVLSIQNRSALVSFEKIRKRETDALQEKQMMMEGAYKENFCIPSH